MTVFISYRSADKDKIENLSSKLEKHKVVCNFDKSFLDIGDKWEVEISKKISECSVFLLIISPNTFPNNDESKGKVKDRSDYVVQEIESALLQQKHIIPIFIDKGELSTEYAGLSPALSQIRRIETPSLDLSRDIDIEKIVKAIKNKENNGNTEPSLPLFAFFFFFFTALIVIVYFVFR